MKDVALRAGVSASTVSRVISGHPHISKATSDRVKAVMGELDYHPNAIARNLVRRSSGAIGLVIPNTVEQFFLNPFFPEVLRGITQVAQGAGYDLLLSSALRGQSEPQKLADMVRSKRVDGVILLTSRMDDPLLSTVLEQHIPSAVIGRPPNDERVYWVNNDNQRAAYDATMHLLQLGHTRVGFIGGAPDLVVTRDRLTGYGMALEQFGLRFDPALVVNDEFVEQVGYAGMMRLLAFSNRPSAVLTADDVLAFGAMRAAGELGYRIPDDMAIIGFNDIPLARLANPAITTVNVHIYELGETAARLLLEQFTDAPREPRHVIVAHELVVRRTCGAWEAPDMRVEATDSVPTRASNNA